MNKNMAGILSAAAVLPCWRVVQLMIVPKTRFVQPVVKDVKKGMSRAQVAQIAGKPSSEVSMIHARGTCRPTSWVNVMVKQKPALSR
ncbi:osmotically-inducible lipoprotein OsmE [Shigella flexneri]